VIHKIILKIELYLKQCMLLKMNVKHVGSGGNINIDTSKDSKKVQKILVVGDLHFHEGDLILPQLFISKIRKLLNSGSYNCVVLLGDIFHRFKTVDQPALASVTELFDTITNFCPLFVLVGNHDYINGSQFLTKNHTLQPFDKWSNVKVIDTPTKIKMPNCRLLLVPYVPKGRFLEALEDVSGWEKIDMIFAHQEFAGCQMGGHFSLDGDCWSDKFPPIISGHSHTKHKVGTNIFYIGMPYDLGYGDTQNKYVAELIFDSDTYKINYIDTELPRKRLVRLPIKEAREWVPEGNDFYKLKVLCTQEEYTSFSNSNHAKQLRMAGVKILRVSEDNKRVEEFLTNKKKQVEGYETYTDIFHSLLEKEGLSNLSKQIFS